MNRMAVFVLPAIRAEDGQFIPCIAKEGEPGYYPTKWRWGRDEVVAMRAADNLNMELGLSPREAIEIVASTLRAQAVGA